MNDVPPLARAPPLDGRWPPTTVEACGFEVRCRRSEPQCRWLRDETVPTQYLDQCYPFFRTREGCGGLSLRAPRGGATFPYWKKQNTKSLRRAPPVPPRAGHTSAWPFFGPWVCPGMGERGAPAAGPAWSALAATAGTTVILAWLTGRATMPALNRDPALPTLPSLPAGCLSD